MSASNAGAPTPYRNAGKGRQADALDNTTDNT